MLGLLAEYGIWPRVINASVISNTIKVLTLWNKSSCNSTLSCFCLSPLSHATYLISEPKQRVLMEADLAVQNFNSDLPETMP